MPLTSIEAMFDGKQIQLLEMPPVHDRCRVLVTFLEPLSAHSEIDTQGLFWSSFGAWVDERPIEATLQDIHASRKSKTEPPPL